MRLIIAATILLVGFSIGLPAAQGQADGSIGGDADTGADTVDLADSTTTITEITDIAGEPAGLPHVDHSISYEPPCAEWEYYSYDTGDGYIEEGFVCVLHYYCAGERIDDVLFGRIANAPRGAFAEYIDLIGALAEGIANGVVFDREDLAITVAEGGLGERSSSNQMPVFYYCRRGEGGAIAIVEEGFTPSFEWATTIEESYDIEGARTESIETIDTLLRGSRPRIQTVPNVDVGHTYVQLPMWLWIENLEEIDQLLVHSTNDIGTVRLATRATIQDVVFELNDEVVNCELDEMRAFVHGTSSLTDEPPECHYMFTESVEYEIEVTVYYIIEEQLSFRGADTYEWPDAPWIAHPRTPQADITNRTGRLEARQILSVNASPDYESPTD